MGPGPGLDILYVVVSNRQGSCPQRDFGLEEEANIKQVCKIVGNVTKFKDSVVTENKRGDPFKNGSKKHFRSK